MVGEMAVGRQMRGQQDGGQDHGRMVSRIVVGLWWDCGGIVAGSQQDGGRLAGGMASRTVEECGSASTSTLTCIFRCHVAFSMSCHAQCATGQDRVGFSIPNRQFRNS
jgi:hypothetical protein